MLFLKIKQVETYVFTSFLCFSSKKVKIYDKAQENNLYVEKNTQYSSLEVFKSYHHQGVFW